MDAGAVQGMAEPRKAVSVGLVLPLHSENLGAAAEAVRAGIEAAHEREPDSISVNLVATTEAPRDVLSGYKAAAEQNDILIGPLSRSGTVSVASSGLVSKPTIALSPAGQADIRLPPQMLVMGLSVEEEAAQVADWAASEHQGARAIALHTGTAWQRRAAQAFATQWQQHGLEVQAIELAAVNGLLHMQSLAPLQKRLQTPQPTVLFAALDARQARQLRSVIGNKLPLYGTSQLNPFVLSERFVLESEAADRNPEMEGAFLVDIPWQLQADHPAAMIYPRRVVSPDQRPSADLDRLYALGIDAYRVARELALRGNSFELDGVTGRLKVNIENGKAEFDRLMRQASYQKGIVVPVTAGVR